MSNPQTPLEIIEDLLSELYYAQGLIEDDEIEGAIDQLQTQEGVITTLIKKLRD